MNSPESPTETPIMPGTLVTPKHGNGKIRHGGQKGGPPGPGRPPSAIRHSARLAYDERLPFLSRVIDGEMVEHRSQEPGDDAPKVVHRSAEIADRLKALKELREVGLGSLKALNDEEVRDRLAATIADADREIPRLIRRMLDERDDGVTTPEDVATMFVDLVERHWQ